MAFACNLAGYRTSGSEKIWSGKSLLVDFDETLAKCKRKSETSPEYELLAVRRGARESLESVKARDGRCILASAASGWYLDRMLEAADLSQVFDRVYTGSQLHVMAYLKDELIRFTPKSLSRIMGEIAEKNPLANCAMIGNNPASDVPRYPFGFVSVLAEMDTDMKMVISYLERMLIAGNGSFAEGFDALLDSVHECGEGVSLVKTNRWYYGGVGFGPARAVLLGMGLDTLYEQIEDSEYVAIKTG